MNNKLLTFKKTLAEFLGVEIEDIANDDSLLDDLHIQATDLSDLIHKLEEAGFDTSDIDLTMTETVNDLIESLEIEDAN